MPKLCRVSGQEAIRTLERLGFVQVRQRGSHVALKKQMPEGAVGCVVPLRMGRGYPARWSRQFCLGTQ